MARYVILRTDPKEPTFNPDMIYKYPWGEVAIDAYTRDLARAKIWASRQAAHKWLKNNRRRLPNEFRFPIFNLDDFYPGQEPEKPAKTAAKRKPKRRRPR